LYPRYESSPASHRSIVPLTFIRPEGVVQPLGTEETADDHHGANISNRRANSQIMRSIFADDADASVQV
jgi:hypothetical protein